MRKGSKLFGLIIKMLGKKASKEELKKRLISSLDTNKDGKLSLEDYADGKWKDISWWKLGFALAILIGLIVYGYNTGPEIIEFFLTNQ